MMFRFWCGKMDNKMTNTSSSQVTVFLTFLASDIIFLFYSGMAFFTLAKLYEEVEGLLARDFF